MKHILNILLIAAFVVTSQAQSIDEERMHRDLEVAENALSTIISPKNNQFPRLSFGDDIEADYIKDYGVILMVPSQGYGRGSVFGIAETENVGTIYTVKGEKAPKSAKALKAHKAPSADKLEVSVHEKKEHFIEKSKLFLADYAGIIGQLKDDQMISIRRGGDDLHVNNFDLSKLNFAKEGTDSDVVATWSTKMNADFNSELIVETSVAKINALRKGKISREDFFKSVSVVENVRDYAKDADLETLSAMFHRRYKKDLSTTYYSESQPKYSKLSKFGVIVKMKFYSSYEDNNVYSMPTIGKKGLTLKERNQLVMDLLPQFESDFKENLVNYGRTLKNLDSDEVLLFEISMTTCKDCKDFPEVMKFSVKKSVLHKYNRGSLSLNDAVNKVNVERF